jgi:hypothetical protein
MKCKSDEKQRRICDKIDWRYQRFSTDSDWPDCAESFSPLSTKTAHALHIKEVKVCFDSSFGVKYLASEQALEVAAAGETRCLIPSIGHDYLEDLKILAAY